MHNFEHKKLAEEIRKLSEAPVAVESFSEWIQAEGHLDFLRRNACGNDIVVFASGEHAFIHSVVVSNDRLTSVDKGDLLQWHCSPYDSIAGYASGGGHNGLWVERGLNGVGSKTLDGGMQLIFGRTFEGWSGPGADYFEANQEYTHVTGIHWRPENRAYCRFDQRGDLESVISVTTREDKGSGGIALTSFKWSHLEKYLAASNASLVRLFDFTMWRSGFSGWSNNAKMFEVSDSLFYNQEVLPGHAGYTRGVQIIRPRRSNDMLFTEVMDGWFGRSNAESVELIVQDWRNEKIVRVSTAPGATCDYFNSEGNLLPYEMSPAFFRPDVLLKYKTDRDKYTVGEREVSCRVAWHLEKIDVNEAGQVHAYIRYLCRLPHEEQLHWLSHNEQPKASISKRAFTHDFEGKWVNCDGPLAKILSIVRQWKDREVGWWLLRDEKLLDRVGTPLSASRDEWAEAFMDLAKLVVEGFETKPIRLKLDAAGIKFQKEEKTITLLEKLLNPTDSSGAGQKFIGLRTVQVLRSKVKGHVGGDEADQLVQEALAKHETFANHFRHVCTQVADELEVIQKLLS